VHVVRVQQPARPGARPNRGDDAQLDVVPSSTPVQQAQEAGELDPRLGPREIAFQLDAFAQSANAHFQLFRDERVFEEARRAIRERIESLRVARAA
jgi:hypothetical protein